MTGLLFEHPFGLLILLVVIELVLIAVWSRRRSDLTTRLVLGVLIGAITLPILSHFVITPRERIVALCHELAGAVEASNIASIRRHLAADFEAAGLNRMEFADQVGGRFDLGFGHFED